MAKLKMNTDDSTSVSHAFLGQTFDLAQAPASLNHGLVVWDASVCFLRFLEANPREAEALRGAAVLELGAGTGLLGIALAHRLGCRVVMTDLDSVVPNLEANLRANPLPPGCAGACRVMAHAWAGAADAAVMAAAGEGGFAYIIGTDVAYSEALNPVLLGTAAAFARASEAARAGGGGGGGGSHRTTTIFVNELRCEVAQGVFDAVAPTLFKVQRVPAKKLHRDFQEGQFLLTRLTLKR